MALSQLRFASFKIPNQVFYQSTKGLSVGLVNLKPLVPGHVLVIPTRVTPRLKDMTPDEVSDLFASVQQISKVIEVEYKAQSLNIALQDGPLAGQSVPHVHVHIIPRRAKDWEPMDEMYSALESKDLAADHAAQYASRPTRADRKAAEHLASLNLTPQQIADFAAQQAARACGNVETPFAGIEDADRKPRSRAMMREEAERLSALFPEGNRGVFGEVEEEE